jgi:hypothetical protein
MFVEGPRECDCCDQIKMCASIDVALTNFVWVICKDCLLEFANSEEFLTEREIRKKKLEKITNVTKKYKL